MSFIPRAIPGPLLVCLAGQLPLCLLTLLSASSPQDPLQQALTEASNQRYVLIAKSVHPLQLSLRGREFGRTMSCFEERFLSVVERASIPAQQVAQN